MATIYPSCILNIRFLLTFCLAEGVLSQVALKKLTTFAFAALLCLAGSAQLSASKGGAAELSPYLHIVPKAQKADKKTGPGFMAFLKRSARGLGQTFVAAVQIGGKNSVRIAQKAPLTRSLTLLAKLGKKSDVRVALPATGVRPAFFAAMDFQRNSEPVRPVQENVITVYIRLFEAKTGSLPPPWGADQSFVPKAGLSAGLREDYSFLRRLWNLLRPGVSLKPGDSPHARTNNQPQGVWPGKGYVRALWGLANGPESPKKAPGMGKNRIKFHLTIDPAKPAILLTHGSMGEGSALRRHRSRDHRSQSV